MWNAARNMPLNPAIPPGQNSTYSLMYVLHCSIIYNVIANFKRVGIFMSILFGSSSEAHQECWFPAMLRKHPV